MGGAMSITAIEMKIMAFIVESNEDKAIHVCSVMKEEKKTVN